jgi:addiction module RelE/StbE family toxin
MIINFHKSFLKDVAQLKLAQKKRLKKALLLFENSPNHYSLYNHSLTGEWKGHRSISFGGDWRAHYIQQDKNTVQFLAIGTHSQLYK